MSGLTHSPGSVGPERAAKIRRLRNSIDKARCRTADWLLSDLVAARCGTGHFYEASGRAAALIAGVQLSASHDGRWVAAAAGSNCLGLDLVDVGRFDRVAPEVFLNDAELAYLKGSHSASRAGPFVAACWAAKEAYTKRVGVGLYLNPKHLTVRPISERDMRVIGPGGRSRSVVTIHTVDDRHLLAVSGAPGDMAQMSIRTLIQPTKDGRQ